MTICQPRSCINTPTHNHPKDTKNLPHIQVFRVKVINTQLWITLLLITLGQKKTHQVRPELLAGGSDEHFWIGENSLRSPL